MKIDVDIPDGMSGNWRVETFEIKEDDFSLIRFALKGRPIDPGIYKRLMYGGQIVMSNTPAEIRDFLPFFHKAGGHILINGLGLGVLVKALLTKPYTEIESITVVELSEDVIKLVGTHITDPRVRIIQGDAFTWKAPRGMYYNAVWHDIWNDLCADNIEEMNKLHRRYRKKCLYQASWGRRECLSLARQDRFRSWR